MKKENMIFRLKLEIDELVNDIVNKLPARLFKSNITTFLDPSMGGGQFVHAIENRLRKHGHSDENIKQRVFGIEKNELRIKFAINKFNLRGTYSVDKNDTPSIMTNNMEFDCVVGNPPFQNGKHKAGKLYIDFIKFSFQTLKKDGVLAIICPSGWHTADAPTLAELRELIQSKGLIEVQDATHDFPGIGEEIGWFIADTSKQSTIEGKIFLHGDFQKQADAIVQKVKSANVDKINLKSDEPNTIENMKKNGNYSENKTSNFPNKVIHTAKQIYYTNKSYSSMSKVKLGLNYSGHYFKSDKVDYYMPIGSFISGKNFMHIECADISEATLHRNFLSHKLFQFFIRFEKSSGFNTGLKWLPDPKKYNNLGRDAIYKMYNINEKEIKLIEESIG